jgi:hypothetical protein
MTSLRTRLERIKRDLARCEQLAPTSIEVFPDECLCFPAKEPPVFDCEAEVETAAAVKCPLHGKRFEGTGPSMVFRANWLVEGEWKNDFPLNSRQYAKAMRASFPADHHPTRANE